MTQDGWVLPIAVVHTAVTLVHAAVHVFVGVVPGLLDGAFIVGVIIVGPPVGAFLTWKSLPVGPWGFGGTMGGSLAYGSLSHFVLSGPDHVATVGFSCWGAGFLATSAALGILEVLGVVAASRAVSRGIRTPSAPPARSP